jgi:hypothetical protein
VKKVQLPVIGGVRKVIQVPGAASAGTTIAEVGSGTVTLAQLAAAINNILNNTGTTTPPGNTAPSASLVLGPGLSGGGVLIGNVPLRLTAPIPALLAEDGADGDLGPPGPPGPTGAVGATGPQGPAGTGTGGSGGMGTLMMFVPEDTSYDDFLIPGPPGAAGAVGATGATGPAGTGSGGGGTGALQLWIPDDTSYDDQVTAYGLIQGQNGQMRTLGVLTTLVLGEANVAIGGTLIFPGTTPQILASNAGSTIQISANSAVQLGIIGGPQQAVLVASNGQVSLNGATVGPALLVQPGSSTISGATFQAGNGTTAVINTLWKTYNGTVLATMYSNGSFVIGTAGVAALTTGTINVTGGYYINGVSLTQAGNASPTPPGSSMIPEDPYWEEEIYKGPPGGPQFNQTGTFTGTLTGMSGTTTGPVTYTIAGGICILTGSLLGTSNAGTMTLTGLPSQCQPATQTQVIPCNLVNDGDNVSGAAIVIPGSGTITFDIGETSIITNYLALNYAGFLSTGAKGMNFTTIIYTLL